MGGYVIEEHMQRSLGRNLLDALKKHQGAQYGGDKQVRQRRRR